MNPVQRIPRLMLMMPSRLTVGLLLLAAVASRAEVDFVRDVQPIFEKNCYKCHGPEKQKGGLRLDAKSAALKGGDEHGPAIVPGRSAESPVIKFVTSLDPDEKMPPKGDPLTAEQIALLRTWIDAGANWPARASANLDDPARTHWAFQPLKRPAAPPIRNPQFAIRNPIDSFIAAKLADQRLAMSPEADKRTLIRRLYLVLIGLPPTPEEVAAFIADERSEAFEKLVDKLLASPRYGEKWARHWLDVIAFGETHGFEVNTPRDNAWPYRDYVINAFNKDTPYPRFIMEQLAGDSLGVDAATGFIVASAALLPGQIGKDEESKAKARQDELNDMVAHVGGAFLGLTLHCARCHDHKFDPVTQTDYYGLQAIFAGVRHGERPLSSPETKSRKRDHDEMLPKLVSATHRLVQFEPLASVDGGATAQRVPVNAHRNIDRFAPVLTQKLRFTVLATSENNRSEPCLDEFEIYTTDGRNVALATNGAVVTASGEYGGPKHLIVHLNDGRYGNDRSWISKTKGGGWVEVQFAQAEHIEAVVWGRDRLDKYRDRLAVSYRIELARDDGAWQMVATSEDRAPFDDAKKKPEMREPADPAQIVRWHEARGEVEALEKTLVSFAEGPMVYAGRFEQPGASFRLHRGEAMQPREQVAPGTVSAIGAALKLPADAPEQQRRIALAKWLADPANPLPARALVNRIWQQHFGEGIVATPNDLGRNGAQPTHPELLDWLAGEFIRGGWSIKHLQKLIVMSATWRQASGITDRGLRIADSRVAAAEFSNPQSAIRNSQLVDASNRLLWHYPARRLDAEVIRDEMLAVAGTLDLRMGGPGFSVFAPNSNYVRVYDPKPEFGPAEWRRMIYMTKVRMAQDSTFGAFDCPDAGQSQPKRPRSTTAIQALSLFNSGFVNQQASLFAERLQRDAPGGLDAQVRRGFALAFQREPAADEAQLCATLAHEHGLPAVCRVLLNANEFLFLP